MASTAPITGAPAGAPLIFTLLGTRPLQDETPTEYITAAYAIAVVASGSAGDDDQFYNTHGLIRGAFDAIALLLANAARMDTDRSRGS